MSAETTTAAIPGRCLPAGELDRATDLLLEATADAPGQAGAAARAAVAEYADWCAVDLLAGEQLERVASAAAHGLDEGELAMAVSRFAAPDPAMLARLELARSPVRVEDPNWLPRHRAVAAAVDGGAGVRGAVTALVPLAGHDLAGDLWFIGMLGRRLAQVLGLSGQANKLGGIVVAEPGGVNGHLREARLRRTP